MHGQYFHNDPMCPNSVEWFLPMKPIQVEMLDPEQYSYLRPCFLCAPAEREAYLTNGRFTEQEILNIRQMDENNSKRIGSERFTLEDWADMNPDGPDVVPDGTDIPREEAIRIAAEAVATEYGIDQEYALSLITMLRCFGSTEYGGFEYNGSTDFKCYSITLLDLEHCNIYYVDIMSSTGDIIAIEKSNFSHLW